MLSFVLQTRNVTSERHTAENLSIEFEKALNEWGLKNLIAVTDNTHNIKNTFAKFLKWENIGYMSHTLNLAVNKCFKVASVSKLLAKCRHIASHFRRTTLQTKILREKQKLLSLNITTSSWIVKFVGIVRMICSIDYWSKNQPYVRSPF